MSTERKYKTVWEHRNPGKPLPSDEEFRQMREQAVEYFRKRLEDEPSLFDHYARQSCTCCSEATPSDDHSALSD